MKKLIFAISMVALLAACKGDKPTAAKEQVESNVKTSPAVRDGNIIRQKVTVGGNQSQNINIDAPTALKMLKENPGAKILDVRTPDEVADGIFPNAIHIDIKRSDFKSELTKLNKEDIHIVYCKSGGRSGKAVDMMRAMGFNQSYNMTEGYSGITKATNK